MGETDSNIPHLSGALEQPQTLAPCDVRDELISHVQQQSAASEVPYGPTNDDLVRVIRLQLPSQRCELMGFTLAAKLLPDRAPSRRLVRRLEGQCELIQRAVAEMVPVGELRRLDAVLWLSDVRRSDAAEAELTQAVAARAQLPHASLIAARCLTYAGHHATLPEAARLAVDGVFDYPHPGILAAVARGMGDRARTLASLRYFGNDWMAVRHSKADAKICVGESAALRAQARCGDETTQAVVDFGCWD